MATSSSSMITKATLVICAVGAIGSLWIGFAGLGWSLMVAEDILIFPLVTGPYALIAGLAWWQRSSRQVSIALLLIALLFSTYGFWSLGSSFYLRYSRRQAEHAMDLTPIVMPAIQWLLSIALALGIGVAVARKPKR